MITVSNQPQLNKLRKWKTTICCVSTLCFLILQIYIAITAFSLVTQYNDYVYCEKNNNGKIINCSKVDELPFALYYKTYWLSVINTMCSIIIFITFILIASYLFEYNADLDITLKIFTNTVVIASLITIAVNMWHIFDISQINETEIVLWNNVDTKFIGQYQLVKMLAVFNVCNMLLVCI